MRLRITAGLLPLLAVVALSMPPQETFSAQYPQSSLGMRYASGWENDRVRLRTISLEPGATAPVQSDAVLVFLTADLQGRIPPADAVWQPAGAAELINRGRRRVEAVVIELKNAPPAPLGVTPPEALPSTGVVDTSVLIDNPRVIVTRQRYYPVGYAAGPRHFHPQDAVIVYLRGGYTWVVGPYGGWVPYSVRRGDIDVVPANTLHRFSNAGSDPLEFLVIFPK